MLGLPEGWEEVPQVTLKTARPKSCPSHPQPSSAIVYRLCLFRLAQEELSGRGAAFVVGLHEHGRIGEGGFFDFHFDFGTAGGIGYGLGIKRSGVGTGEAENQPGSGGG